MLQQRFYYLYLILSVIFPIAIMIYGSNVSLNIRDSYLVIVPTRAALLIFLLFFLFAANYFLMRKYVTRTFGTINLSFLVIPLLYFFLLQSKAELNYSIDSHWDEYLNLATLLMFLMALIMFVISLTTRWWKPDPLRKQ